MVIMIMYIVPGVPYSVSVATVNRAGQGSITTLTNFTKELGINMHNIYCLLIIISLMM